ncbi:uridylate kinase [Micromonospora sp. DT47]|uniref:uridylate kinase n=1 Tax=Micromonospora sp. DT47 TaxID=3393431 RepID=UPI003CF3CAC8
MDMVGRLAAVVTSLSRKQDRVLVGVDGPDVAGKTTLADQLARALDVPTLRASIDGFHQSRELRYQRGELSAEGYYRDSFDHQALLSECLRPFGEGVARVQIARYDHKTDAGSSVRVAEVPARAVLIFDGVFLLREQLRDQWTLSVYLRVSPRETLRRAKVRDMNLFGSHEEIERRYLGRYLPGQALYRSEVDPEAIAQVVVDNDRADAPTVKRWMVPVVENSSDKRRFPSLSANTHQSHPTMPI